MEFTNLDTIKTLDRKLTKSELIAAIRLSISAEYDAVTLYIQLAESTDNKKVKKVSLDIANEEKVHAGEFLALLKELDPNEEEYYQEGEEEVGGLVSEEILINKYLG